MRSLLGCFPTATTVGCRALLNIFSQMWWNVSGKQCETVSDWSK